jgi:hypothetical protein
MMSDLTKQAKQIQALGDKLTDCMSVLFDNLEAQLDVACDIISVMIDHVPRAYLEDGGCDLYRKAQSFLKDVKEERNAPSTEKT